jgi:hypothetical protein
MRGLDVILTAVPAGIFCKIYGWRSVDVGPQSGDCQGLSLYLKPPSLKSSPWFLSSPKVPPGP